MKLAIVMILVVQLTGCATLYADKHFSEAILFKENGVLEAADGSKKGNNYALQDVGSNPIFVDRDSSFIIEIDHLQPGWMHSQTSRADLDDGIYKRWSDKTSDHILGKELWLLTKIQSISSDDVLERNSKIYFKSTNVKLNSSSFTRVALDLTEREIFTHLADSQYRITFKLYEVDGFDLKRATVRAYDRSKGISDLVVAAGETLLTTAGNLAGSIVTELWSSASEEDLFIERLLLENGGTVELQGTVNVLTDRNIIAQNDSDHDCKVDSSYILYDPFKSNMGWESGFDKSRSEYIAAFNTIPGDVDILDKMPKPNEKGDYPTYLKINVTQLYPDAYGSKYFSPKDVCRKIKGLPPISTTKSTLDNSSSAAEVEILKLDEKVKPLRYD